MAITLSLVISVGGALWTLANRLRDRPTTHEVHRAIDGHEVSGHGDLRDSIGSIHKEQGAQGERIGQAAKASKANAKKLDMLLERTPERRRTRRRPR